MERKNLIVNNIREGDVIVGLASYGTATYEKVYNSGIGSNGLTSARHDVLSKHYKAHYPESYDPKTPEEVIYIGHRKLTEEVEIGGSYYETGALVLSPTRTYLPVIKQLVDKIGPSAIHGMIHCTGGGQSKVLHFIQGKRIIKNNLLPIPPVFQLIQQETDTSWKEMYQVFNMGHRLEVYLSPDLAEEVITIANDFGIDAQVIGAVEANDENRVVVDTANGTYEYQ